MLSKSLDNESIITNRMLCIGLRHWHRHVQRVFRKFYSFLKSQSLKYSFLYTEISEDKQKVKFVMSAHKIYRKHIISIIQIILEIQNNENLRKVIKSQNDLFSDLFRSCNIFKIANFQPNDSVWIGEDIVTTYNDLDY